MNTKYLKKYYNLLYDDLCRHNRKYRLRLGYPEPILFNIVKYQTGKIKLSFFTLVFALSLYVAILFQQILITLKLSGFMQNIITCTIGVCIIGIMFLLFLWGVYFVTWIIGYAITTISKHVHRK